MAGGARRPSLQGIRPGLEVGPSILSDPNLGVWDRTCVLPKHVQQDDQVLGSAVQHAVELSPVVAAEFSELAPHLGAVWEREVGAGRGEHVQAVDLVVEDDLSLGIEAVDAVADGPVRRGDQSWEG